MQKGRGWIFAYLLTICGALILVKAGSRAVTVVAQNIPMPRQHCVVIDPGHGGVDGGATSCTGKLESEYNLEIALRLRDLLELLGHQTRMIRTTDESVYTEGSTIARKKVSDLRQRVKMTNETPDAVLVSIHQNQFTDSRYHGAQVFYAGTDSSEQLAEKLQKTMNASLKPASGREHRPSRGVYLMEHIRCPGILVECGFLSNPGDADRLAQKAYQQQLCCVIGAVVHEFLG